MAAERTLSEAANEAAFRTALNDPAWTVKLRDSGTEDYRRHWFVDGATAAVANTGDGWELRAVPVDKDENHVVAWTRDVFSGDIKVEYEFTRLDQATRQVNIIYLMAHGYGPPPYVADISAWSELRSIPAMRHYFDLMNAYHISYAVNTPDTDYIRARYYRPKGPGGKSLGGTEIPPDIHEQTGLFPTGKPYRLTVMKANNRLFFLTEGEGQRRLCVWSLERFAPLESGRVGLRQMYGRASRYRDLTISTKPATEAR